NELDNLRQVLGRWRKAVRFIDQTAKHSVRCVADCLAVEFLDAAHIVMPNAPKKARVVCEDPDQVPNGLEHLAVTVAIEECLPSLKIKSLGHVFTPFLPGTKLSPGHVLLVGARKIGRVLRQPRNTLPRTATPPTSHAVYRSRQPRKPRLRA